MTGSRRREDVAGGGNSLQRAAHPQPKSGWPAAQLARREDFRSQGERVPRHFTSYMVHIRREEPRILPTTSNAKAASGGARYSHPQLGGDPAGCGRG
jgi:hypothetical protein